MAGGVECTMRTITKSLATLGALILQCGCRGAPEEHRAYIVRGDLQIGVRTQEWEHSGIVNVQACLMPRGSKVYPKDGSQQCFFAGYDLTQLGVRWNRDDDVTISMACGQVTEFENWALVDVRGRSDRIHVNLTDRCTTTHYQFIGLNGAPRRAPPMG
jgi:hypothetical protein